MVTIKEIQDGCFVAISPEIDGTIKIPFSRISVEKLFIQHEKNLKFQIDRQHPRMNPNSRSQYANNLALDEFYSGVRASLIKPDLFDDHYYLYEKQEIYNSSSTTFGYYFEFKTSPNRESAV